MNHFLKGVIGHRKITFTAIILLIFGGFYSYYLLPRQENPQIASPTALVTTVLPGAKAETMEALISKKVEDQAALLEGVEEIKSIASDSVSIVMVTLNTYVDKDKQWDELNKKIEGIQNDFPENTRPSKVETDLIETVGIVLSVSGEGVGYDSLEHFSSSLEEYIKGLEGIKRTEVLGSPQKEIEIVLDQHKLNQQNIAIDEIASWIQAQNVNIPSGGLDTAYGKINVSVPNAIESIQDLEELIINASEETGSVVRLKDVAQIQFKYDDTAVTYRHQGAESVLVTAFFEKDRNIVTLGNQIEQQIDQISKAFPQKIQVEKVVFQPTEVKKAVNDFALNLLEGIVFVVLVIFLGMGLRNALVVATSLPLTLCLTFIEMKVLGIELQQISIAALIIALGMLVDNAIVISDSIQGYLDGGMDKEEAAFLGAKVAAIPVFTSTLTTIAAFAPLAVLPGEAGVFVKSLPQIVILTLANSYGVAMLAIPALSVNFFKAHQGQKEKRRLRLLFEKGLDFGLSYKKWTLLIAALVFVICVRLAMTMTIEIFPYVDKDVLYMNVTNQKKDGIQSTKVMGQALEGYLKKIPEIKGETLAIGGPLPKFYMTVSTHPKNTDFIQGMIVYDLEGSAFHSKKDFSLYLQQYLEANVVGANIEVKPLELTAPGPDIEVKVESEDVLEAQQVARAIYDQMKSLESTYNVSHNIAPRQYEYQVTVNEDERGLYGLSKYDIQKQVNMALYGQTITHWIKEGKRYPIRLTTNLHDLADLENFKIKSSATGQKIMLRQFSEIALGSKMTTLTRLNRKPSVEISANVKPGYGVQEVQASIEAAIAKEAHWGNVKISYGGEKMVLDKYLSGLGLAAVFALLAIFLILLVQFNSFKQPLIILVTVPLSIIGSVFGLMLLRQPLTFTVGLGVASLIGVVVNNAILLIEFINRGRDQGMDVHEACIQSVEQRFRPIMLTTTTTVIGLIPLLLTGSSFFGPMAIALMGGLMVSTLLTLIVIPVVYATFES